MTKTECKLCGDTFWSEPEDTGPCGACQFIAHAAENLGHGFFLHIQKMINHQIQAAINENNEKWVYHGR